MKLLTLNCHSWQEKEQLEKINHLAKVIKEQDFDVIALQEVSQHMNEAQFKGNLKADNYVVVLQKALEDIGGPHYDVVWDFAHIGYDVYEEGLCLLSKHPIKDQRSIFVSQSQDKNNWKTRNIVSITVEYNGKLIDFYSCHLWWWHDEEEPFKEQFKRLNESINSNRQTFLLGDFNNNANVRNEGYDYIKSLGFLDTFELAKVKDEGITARGKIDGWEANREALRLDLVLTNSPITVNSSKVIFNGENEAVVSDHYGVIVEIEV